METFATFRVGRERLAGMLHLPDGGRPAHGFPSVVMLHGLGGDRSEYGRLFTLASRYFSLSGLVSLRFDFRGSGDSDGDHAEMTLSREVEDTFAAFGYIRDLPEIDSQRVSLLGFSVGGLVAALAAQHAAPRRLALWAPTLPSELLKLLPLGHLPASVTEFRGMGVGRNLLAELPRLDPLRAVASAGRVTHVFQGERDERSPLASGRAYAEAAGAPYSLVPKVGHHFEHTRARESLYEGTLRFLLGA